jgi:hypothetical protein
MITITLWTPVLRKVKRVINWNHRFHVTNIDYYLSLHGTEVLTSLSDTDLVYLTMLSKGQTALNSIISEQRITQKDMVII